MPTASAGTSYSSPGHGIALFSLDANQGGPAPFGFEIGIGIVMQSPLGKPVPKLPQVLSYQAIVKAWEFGGLLFKIPLDLSVVVQALTNFSVIP